MHANCSEVATGNTTPHTNASRRCLRATADVSGLRRAGDCRLEGKNKLTVTTSRLEPTNHWTVIEIERCEPGYSTCNMMTGAMKNAAAAADHPTAAAADDDESTTRSPSQVKTPCSVTTAAAVPKSIVLASNLRKRSTSQTGPADRIFWRCSILTGR